MKQPTKEIIAALARLEGDADFCVVIGWLKESQADTDKSLRVMATSPQKEWLQGKAQTLEQILTKAETARETMQARSSKPGHPSRAPI